MNTPIKPKHVAIVMDGNGRWAESQGLPRFAGHEAGIAAIEKTIRAAIHHHIPVLTLFAFGIENWKRPDEEVNFLMHLFLTQLDLQTAHFIENNIRLRIIGDRIHIDPEHGKKIEEVELATAKNTGLVLVIAFNYSGRWDILQATKQLCQQVYSAQLHPKDITDRHLQTEMALSDLPEPDLLIRTSGEQRISNFMLWQLAYTEFYFTEIAWPDFDQSEFEKALQAFASRQRRYGLIGKQTAMSV